MKHLLLFILFFVSLKTFAQPVDQSKWKIGLVYSTDFLYSNSVSFGNETGYNLHRHGLPFTTGVIAQFKIKPRLEIGAGIEYSSKQYDKIYYYTIPPWVDPIILPASLLELQYIEIPVTARYNFLNKTVHIHVETGLINGYLTKNNIKNKHIEYYERELPINGFILSGELGLGVNFDLKSRMNFSFTTVYRHSLTEFAEGASSKLKSIGLMFGITYNLKKKN